MLIELEIFSALGYFALVALSLVLLGGAQRRICQPLILSFMQGKSPLDFFSIGFTNTIASLDCNSVSSTLFGYCYSKMITNNGALYSLLGIALGPLIVLIPSLFLLRFSELYLFTIPIIGLGFIFLLINYRFRTFGRLLMSIGLFLFALFICDGSLDVLFHKFVFSEELYAITSFGVPAILFGCAIGVITSVILRNSFLGIILFSILLTPTVLGVEFMVGAIIGSILGLVFIQAPMASRAGVNAMRALMHYFIGFIIGLIIFCLCYSIFSLQIDEMIETPQIATISLLGFFTLCFLPLGIYLSGFLTRLVYFLVPNLSSDNLHLAVLSKVHRPDATLSLLQAQKEITNHIRRTYKMMSFLRDMVNEYSEPQRSIEKIDELYERVKKYKKITDRVENEIVVYICSVAQGDITIGNTLQMQNAIVRMGQVNQLADSILSASNLIRCGISSQTGWDENQISSISKIVHQLQLLQYAVISSFEDQKEENIDVLYENLLNMIENSNEKIYLYNQVLIIEVMTELKKTGKILCHLSKKQ